MDNCNRLGPEETESKDVCRTVLDYALDYVLVNVVMTTFIRQIDSYFIDPEGNYTWCNHA